MARTVHDRYFSRLVPDAATAFRGPRRRSAGVRPTTSRTEHSVSLRSLDRAPSRAGVLFAALLLASCHSTPPAPAPDTRTAANRPSPSARPNDATPSIPAKTPTLPAAGNAASRGPSDV